eukprot:TRINITY_DN30850_c0_g1_i1.p1 TRINITY_DN30850_c0_g1~~TRINITY_DN30850_c0_g1_i1.p1  ORF type:complete len:137 (+),score=23.07 TRINITY_DN30850_c0_g1_i1:75-485(+)
MPPLTYISLHKEYESDKSDSESDLPLAQRRKLRRCGSEPSENLRWDLYKKLTTFPTLENGRVPCYHDYDWFRAILSAFFRPAAELHEDPNDEDSDMEEQEVVIDPVIQHQRRVERLRTAKESLLNCLPPIRPSMPF